MSTFITRLDKHGSGARVAVKDLIDMVGLPTTAGCRAVANHAKPARADAACLAGIRDAEADGKATIIGKTNLHELAAGATGINPWYGTPTNPVDSTLVPGGSSSGSAVAVAVGEADVALGSDTGGSVRIPSACCGTAGLKTTWGRISTDGVWPLAPSLDTIGPMARDVAGLVTGMELLEPGFVVGESIPARVGRYRLSAHPEIDAAIDALLRTAELEVAEVVLDGWEASSQAAFGIFMREVWESDGHLLTLDPAGVGSELRDGLLAAGQSVPDEQFDQARTLQAAWQAEWSGLFEQVDAVALPTLVDFPPRIDEGDTTMMLVQATMPINVAGLPSLALPVPTARGVPTSVQLVGPAGSEERLLALGRVVEEAARASR